MLECSSDNEDASLRGGGSRDESTGQMGDDKPIKKNVKMKETPPSNNSQSSASSVLKSSKSSSRHSVNKSISTSESFLEQNTNKVYPEDKSISKSLQLKGNESKQSRPVTDIAHVNPNKYLSTHRKSSTLFDRDGNRPVAGPLVPPLKKKVRVDVSARSLERNFMTIDRAMSEFLLLPEDLEGLPRTTRRSPYKDGPEITVLKRNDVVERAHSVWGSRGKMIEEQDQRRQIIQRRLPRDHRRLAAEMRERYGLFSSSGLVVVGAVVVNLANLILKFVAWWFTSSLALFAEFLHSMGDTSNQVVVAVCMHLSYKRPTIDHPYGYTNLKFVSAVIAGTLILSVGAGVSIYQGIEGLIVPRTPTHLIWALGVLVFAGITELVSLFIAVRDITHKARKRSLNFFQYVRLTQEPSVNVVLFEDCVAVLTVLITLVCLGMCWAMNTYIPDCVGSILQGILLAVISVVLVRSNATFLIGKSIPPQKLEKINTELESDVMIRAIHDVKGIDLGNFNVRYKAELDFDGRELTRAYLDRVDMNTLFNSTKDISNVDELEDFMLRHGEALVDMLGGEIDRIEQKLKKADPDIRHCDLEIL